MKYLKGAELNSEFYVEEFQNSSEYVLTVEKVSKRKKHVFLKLKKYDDSYRSLFNKNNAT